jgi:hypothetical protein
MTTPTVDDIIADLESRGLGWSLDHTGTLIEARVWDWPTVIARYRPAHDGAAGQDARGSLLRCGLDGIPGEGMTTPQNHPAPPRPRTREIALARGAGMR